MSNRLLNSPVKELHLSEQAERALEAMGIQNIGQPLGLSENALRSGAGDAWMQIWTEIQQRLSEHSLRGTVRRGVVVLEDDVPLPDGAIVTIRLAPPDSDDAQRHSDELMNLAGTVKGLPPDFSENHDHYLHGQPSE